MMNYGYLKGIKFNTYIDVKEKDIPDLNNLVNKN